MTSPLPTIFILYNAKASLFGKLSYGYRKLSAPADKSPCAACDLTHGGLRLDETAEWKATKQRIPADIKQLHQDELTADIQKFVDSQQPPLRYPVVLGQNTGATNTNNSPLHVLLTAEDLAKVSKDHSSFVDLLAARTKQADINLEWPAATTPNL